MSKKTILVVDDNSQNILAISALLEGQYKMRAATNGKKALSLANSKDNRPDLILLDIQMPGMSGYEVCDKLKETPLTTDIPVIFLTALTDAEDETEGFKRGAVDYIHKPFNPLVVNARIKAQLSLVNVAKLNKSHRDAISMLGRAGHYNDVDTGVHIWRMAAYSAKLAAAIGWDAEACEQLELAAPMHDMGKIGIPHSILRKPGKLDSIEWEIMKTHSRIGYNILSQSDAPLFQLAAEIALRHHEKWDGSGYPDGLVGQTIPEAARIVALADVFDALTMHRPYKEAWPINRVMQSIQESIASHFEPRLVELFEKILPEILNIKEEWDKKELCNVNTGCNIY